MEWNSDRSICLSRVCVAVFALLLAALDVGAYWFVGFFIRLRGMSAPSGLLMMISVYLCSVFGWLVLWRLWRLLANMRLARVFVSENVAHLRVVSWCCAAVAVICLFSSAYYLPFLVAAMAAAFMALIVRIVKNVFQQALRMKDELDFTV